MNYPTTDELKAAYDGITADGEQAEPTVTLCTILTLNPLMRDMVRFTTNLANGVFARTVPEPRTADALLREAFIMSCIVKGLNLGMRISDARQKGAAKI